MTESSPEQNLQAKLHEIERTDETAVLSILKVVRRAQDFRSTEELFNKIVNGVISIYKAYYHVSMFMLTEDGKSLECVAIAGESALEMNQLFPDGYSQPIDVGICGQVFKSGEKYLSNDVSADPHFVTAMNTRTKSELCIAILDGRRCVGGLNIESDQVGTFTATDVYLFEVLAHAIGNSLSRDRINKTVLEVTGALGALGSSQESAVVVLTPDGQFKYGNSKFAPYRKIGGLLEAIASSKEGVTFEHTGELPDGSSRTARATVTANRGGYIAARVVDAG